MSAYNHWLFSAIEGNSKVNSLKILNSENTTIYESIAES